MHTPEMYIQRRAFRAALACALSTFALARSPGARADTGPSEGGATTPLALLDPLLAPLAPLADAWRDAIADAPVLRAVHAFATHPAGAAGLVALALGLAAFAVVRARRRHRTGRMTLRLAFPESVDGAFSVALRRHSGRRPRPWPFSRSSRRTTRTGVQRETQFDGLAPGRWLLTIEGALCARSDGTLLASIDEEREVEIEAHGCAAIEHALPPVEVPLELRVQWDQQPARDVRIARADRPETLRRSRSGVTRLSLPPGEHALLIGAGDRVVEHTVRIADYEPVQQVVDLASAEGLVFKGCPPAVAAFMQGDLGHAARALERDGQREVAALLLARLHRDQGATERAAELLEGAGRLQEAAELQAERGDYARAARLFEQAGDLHAAAGMYEVAEAWAEAARTWAALGEWPDAARGYEAAGNVEGWIHALEQQGEILRAAALASEHDDRAGVIRLLQLIGPKDPEYGRAGELLALAYEQEGHLDLAASQLERVLEALPPAEASPELELHLAELLEETGEVGRALEIVQRLRDRDPTREGVAARIEGLRKKLTDLERSSPRAAAHTAPPGATAFVTPERYELLEEIGRGGMGLVYKARDRRLGRIVALKRMPESLRDHPAAVQLFVGEAQAAARMNHPNIVTLYDADQADGAFFITMELLEGLPLNTLLKQRGRFGPRDSARLVRQACAGLHYAHEHGIVHRDIKTANLFITREKVLKIMDFGLAKILEAVRADGGSTVIAGTPFYMAPEQAAGRVADGRTDLYALGVTLFELSTGRLPFTEGDVAAQHREAQVPDPAAGIPGYPAALSALIRRLMAKAPEERPPSAAEVAERLEAIILASESGIDSGGAERTRQG